jgi:hypothetical protein
LDEGEDQEGDGPVPPYSSGFLNPRLKALRGPFFKATLLGTLLTVLAIFAFLPMCDRSTS